MSKYAGTFERSTREDYRDQIIRKLRAEVAELTEELADQRALTLMISDSYRSMA